MEENKLRIRLVFGNGVLSKFQKKNGLRRSWVLLKPHLETISDVVSYLLYSFDLHDSCPNGIILSMDGFVLPEFESTTIFKDKDIICVKRKEPILLQATDAIEDAMANIEDEVVEKQSLPPDFRLLAIEEFDKETRNNQIETDEDEDEAGKSPSPVRNASNGDLASKKRKASSKSENPKKKRKLQAVVNTVQEKQFSDCENTTKPQKKKKHKNRRDQNALSSSDVKRKCVDKMEPESYSDSELDGKSKDTIPSSEADRVKKVSRSTRRKKSKREYKRLNRDKAKLDEFNRQEPVKDMTTDTGIKKDMVANVTQQADEDSEAEGDLVPVTIRPGLIRFTPSGKVKDVQEIQGTNAHSTQNGTLEEHSAPNDDSGVDYNQVAKEAYCWNGITSKRKGQKWGREKQPNSTWKDSRDYNGRSWKDSRENGQTSSPWASGKQSTSSWHDSVDFNGSSSNAWAEKKHPPKSKPVDFDKLIPLIDLPKAGDIIAYRLLELSSSWCPELSSFRVGKITSFDAESNKIMLVPVPEYPLNLEKKAYDHDDADEQPLGSSIYNEDGSLETDFPSLNDVRILKLADSTLPESTKVAAANGSSAPPISKKDDAAKHSTKNTASAISDQELETPCPANGKKDVWEEITEAVSAKKAQLLQEDSWNKKETPAKRPWSYRSARSSAIGPTMARLRAQNGA